MNHIVSAYDFSAIDFENIPSPSNEKLIEFLWWCFKGDFFTNRRRLISENKKIFRVLIEITFDSEFQACQSSV